MHIAHRSAKGEASSLAQAMRRMGPHTRPTIRHRLGDEVRLGTHLEHGRDLPVLDDLDQRSRGPGRPVGNATEPEDEFRRCQQCHAKTQCQQARCPAAGRSRHGQVTGTMEAPNGSMQPMSFPRPDPDADRL